MKRFHVAITALLVSFYVARCLSVFWMKPPVDFVDLPDVADRQAISDWYRSTSAVPRQPWALDSLGYAMVHPGSPHRFHPSVTEGGLGGDGSVMLSYCGFVGIFTRTGPGGTLEFHRFESQK